MVVLKSNKILHPAVQVSSHGMLEIFSVHIRFTITEQCTVGKVL